MTGETTKGRTTGVSAWGEDRRHVSVPDYMSVLVNDCNQETLAPTCVIPTSLSTSCCILSRDRDNKKRVNAGDSTPALGILHSSLTVDDHVAILSHK